MRRLVWLLVGLLCGPLFAQAQTSSVVLNKVLDAVEARTLDYPKVWFRWNQSIFASDQCWSIDVEKIQFAPRHDFLPLSTVIGLNAELVGFSTLTAVQRAMCFSTLRPAPPVPAVVFRVAPTTLTRPMFSGSAWETSGLWVGAGSVEIGAVCEAAVIRHTTVDYHYVTNAAGVRGLAVCK